MKGIAMLTPFGFALVLGAGHSATFGLLTVNHSEENEWPQELTPFRPR